MKKSRGKYQNDNRKCYVCCCHRFALPLRTWTHTHTPSHARHAGHFRLDQKLTTLQHFNTIHIHPVVVVVVFCNNNHLKIKLTLPPLLPSSSSLIAFDMAQLLILFFFLSFSFLLPFFYRFRFHSIHNLVSYNKYLLHFFFSAAFHSISFRCQFSFF